MSGHDRAILYLFAVETGLRASAIHGLLINDFDFENSKVNIRPEVNKTRVSHTVYLKQERAKQLKEYFRGKLPGVKAFKTNVHTREADMIKADLALTKVYDASGAVAIPEIPYKDSEGRKACFHSLRCSMDTELKKITKDDHLTKILMGHLIPKSDMTAHYRTVDPKELRGIVEQLPDYEWPQQREAMAATGTDGKAVDENLLESCRNRKFCSNRNGNGKDLIGLHGSDNTNSPPIKAIETAKQSLYTVTPKEEKSATQAQEQGHSTADKKILSESYISDPDLLKIVKAWPGLPEHIKTSIKALIDTQDSRGGG
jgi:hypothetical protein